MSRNYLNSQAFRDYDASYDGKTWQKPPNTQGREWTPTDAADAEDDRVEREYWRKEEQ